MGLMSNSGVSVIFFSLHDHLMVVPHQALPKDLSPSSEEGIVSG